MKRKDHDLKYRYGITLDQFNQLLAKQNNCCAICNKELIRNVHVDHDHNDKKIRGLLCARCNMMLGYAKDNPDILKSAINYLNNKKNLIIPKDFKEEFKANQKNGGGHLHKVI
jgi:hypothetical protein